MRSLKEGLDLLIPRGVPDRDFARRPVEMGDMMGRDFQKAVDAAVAMELARAVAQEREDCARTAETIYGTDGCTECDTKGTIAAAIRARNEQK